jgi:hypothetical protein
VKVTKWCSVSGGGIGVTWFRATGYFEITLKVIILNLSIEFFWRVKD